MPVLWLWRTKFLVKFGKLTKGYLPNKGYTFHIPYFAKLVILCVIIFKKGRVRSLCGRLH